VNKKVLIGAIVLAFILGGVLTFFLFNGSEKVSYWKGRSEQALEDLQQAEKIFEEAVEQDKVFQKEKDKRIAKLEEGIAKDNQRIVYIERDIVVTRETLIASGLYKGLVKELDEKWASKYATLESKLDKKDAQLKEWQEKFDSKVELAMKEWVDKDLAQKKAIQNLQKQCTAQETQIKGLKLWTAVGKIWTGYHAVKGGTELVKGIL